MKSLPTFLSIFLTILLRECRAKAIPECAVLQSAPAYNCVVNVAYHGHYKMSPGNATENCGCSIAETSANGWENQVPPGCYSNEPEEPGSCRYSATSESAAEEDESSDNIIVGDCWVGLVGAGEDPTDVTPGRNEACTTPLCAEEDESDLCGCTLTVEGKSWPGVTTKDGSCFVQSGDSVVVYKNSEDAEGSCDVLSEDCASLGALKSCSVRSGPPDQVETPAPPPEEVTEDPQNENCQVPKCDPEDQSEECVCSVQLDDIVLAGVVTENDGCLHEDEDGRRVVFKNKEENVEACDAWWSTATVDKCVDKSVIDGCHVALGRAPDDTTPGVDKACTTALCAEGDESDDCVCTLTVDGKSQPGVATIDGNCLIQDGNSQVVYKNSEEAEGSCYVLSEECGSLDVLENCSVKSGPPEDPNEPVETPDPEPSPDDVCQVQKCGPEDQSEECVCSVQLDDRVLAGVVTADGGCLYEDDDGKGVFKNKEDSEGACDMWWPSCGDQSEIEGCQVTPGRAPEEVGNPNNNEEPNGENGTGEEDANADPVSDKGDGDH